MEEISTSKNDRKDNSSNDSNSDKSSSKISEETDNNKKKISKHENYPSSDATDLLHIPKSSHEVIEDTKNNCCFCYLI